MPSRIQPNEIHLTRIFDAPLALVWDAWTHDAKVGHWWGPRGFSLTTHSKDFRPGGSWHYTMHGPDGKDYPNRTDYLEIEKHVRMVYDHGADNDAPPMFRVPVGFEEIDGRSAMDMTMAFSTPEVAANTKKFIKKAGGDATWDRLAEYLAATKSGEDLFVINRSFEAPMEVVYDQWAKPENLSRWLPPTGSNMEFIRADMRVGGESLYRMAKENVTMHGRIRYLEMQPPHRIVYVQQFCDAQGKSARHPLSPTWPETMRTTVLFAKEGDDQTRITVIWSVEGHATPEERTTFHGAKSGMTQGWTGSFDKLEAVLKPWAISDEDAQG